MARKKTDVLKQLGRIESKIFPELGEYKISLGENYVVENEKDTYNALTFVGVPCFMKGISDQELHKSDKGLVHEIKKIEEGIAFFHELEKLKNTNKDIKIVIQKRYQGIELFLGIKNDNVFNYVMIFGFGGVFVEVYKDVAYGILPITKNEMIKVINETKIGRNLISGYRGYGIDIEYLHCLANKSYKLLKEKKYSEIEFNPLIIGKNGTTTAVDIKIVKNEQKNK